MMSYSDDKHALILEIESMDPFHKETDLPVDLYNGIWADWEKLLGGGKLRQVDLIILRSLLEKIYLAGQVTRRQLTGEEEPE